MRGTYREIWNNLYEENFGVAVLVLWHVFNYLELEKGLSITDDHTNNLFSWNFQKIQCFTIMHFFSEDARTAVKHFPRLKARKKRYHERETSLWNCSGSRQSHTLGYCHCWGMEFSKERKEELVTSRVRLQISILLDTSVQNLHNFAWLCRQFLSFRCTSTEAERSSKHRDEESLLHSQAEGGWASLAFSRQESAICSYLAGSLF